MRRALLLAAAYVTCIVAPAAAQNSAAETISPEQIKRGAEAFANHCSPCHGERMSDPMLFNLKTFPADQRLRFISSVSNGKNAMPPWRALLKPDEIEALWAYVSKGEK